MSDRGEMLIRSFSVVFDLERRLHRIDRWRLPLPYGLPIRSIGYGVAALILVLVASRLPVIGTLLMTLPTPARLVLIPTATAYAFTRTNVDGRSAHRTVDAIVRAAVCPRRAVAGRPAPRPGTQVRFAAISFAPDARTSSLRPGVVRGGAVARLRYPVELAQHRRTLFVQRTATEPLDVAVRIAFDASRRLVIR